MDHATSHSGHEATNRLHELDKDLTAQVFIEAVSDAFYDHAVNCTGNDPLTTRGYLMWAKSVRGVADRLSRWTRKNPGGYAITVDPSETIAIVVAAGDEETGRIREGMQPSTRSRKGASTRSAVHLNQQTFGDHAADVQALRTFQTWILLLFEDSVAEEIRLELSLPKEISDGGHVNRWHERILLPTIDVSSISIEPAEEDDAIEVAVERRPQ